MTPSRLVNALVHSRCIETSCQAQRNTNVVSDAFRFQLIEKPQALLREREWGQILGRTLGNLSRRRLLGDRVIQKPFEFFLLQSRECCPARRKFGSSAC